MVQFVGNIRNHTHVTRYVQTKIHTMNWVTNGDWGMGLHKHKHLPADCNWGAWYISLHLVFYHVACPQNTATRLRLLLGVKGNRERRELYRSSYDLVPEWSNSNLFMYSRFVQEEKTWCCCALLLAMCQRNGETFHPQFIRSPCLIDILWGSNRKNQVALNKMRAPLKMYMW